MVKPGGKHLLADFYGVSPCKITNCSEIDEVFRKSAVYAGATVLNSTFHHFGEGCGVTGVLILAESHMSIHSWCEEKYCSVDIFMCGDSDPYKALKVISEYFDADRAEVNFIKRGESYE